MKYAVIKTGGKQYLVKENDEIVVDRLSHKEESEIILETLATFSDKTLELGEPILSHSAKAKVIANLKGDKVRVARFKAKVRYRKVRGFRPSLTRIKIIQI